MAAAVHVWSSSKATQYFVSGKFRRGHEKSADLWSRSLHKSHHLGFLASPATCCSALSRPRGSLPSQSAHRKHHAFLTSSLFRQSGYRQLCRQHSNHATRFGGRLQASAGRFDLVLDALDDDGVYGDEDDYKVTDEVSETILEKPQAPATSVHGVLRLLALAAAFCAISLYPLPATAAVARADPPRYETSAPSTQSSGKKQGRRQKRSGFMWRSEQELEPPVSQPTEREATRLEPLSAAPGKDQLEAAIQARVPYSWFLDAAEGGLVRAVWIINNWAFVLLEEGTVDYKPPESSWLEKMIMRDFQSEKKPPSTLVTVRLPDGDTVTIPALRQARVRFEVVQGGPQWQEQLAQAGQLMWYALLGTMLFTVLGSGELGGLAGMMNKKAKLFQGGKSDTNFSNVAGCDEAKEELVEVVEFLKNSEKYRALGARVPKGVLLCGPAGTGKTLLAKAVAGEADVPFFSMSASEFVEIYGGMGASRVRKTFADCRKKAPCILFIDELDAIGRSRSVGQIGGYDQEREQTLNQMLTEMDGFDSTKDKPVIILGATNRPEILDTALLRPGRFDRTVTVDRPDKKGREEILRLHMKDIKIDKDLDVSSIAGSTIGFTGADLANLVNEAALLAARKNLEQVGRDQLMEAAERSRAGLERKSLKVSDIERRTVAFHECGHALVGSMSREVVRSTVTKISIVPRGSGALGYTLNEPQEDRYLQGEDDIRSFITVALAGRAAERIVFGRLTSGASDDLQRATESAERMVTLFGMSSKVGPRALRSLRQSYLEEQGYASGARQGGPQLQKIVDDEINGILQAADDWCQRILVRNRALLDEMAEKLLAEEVLQESQLEDFLKRADAPDGLEDWFKTGKLPDGFDTESIYRTAPAIALPG